jgi:2-polyprenyl-3-methyl-5-hydroxy-6-metoxy-1,4-benzoquinol methylase
MQSEEKGSSYYQQYRDDISGMVAGLFTSNASFKVLDVGCGEGFLAAYLSQKFENASITGIELNEEAAREARKKCREVIVADIEKMPLNTAGFMENEFDCVILADILEHLVNPWAVVKKIRKALKDSGKIVASIPNIGNYGVIYFLLNGK